MEERWATLADLEEMESRINERLERSLRIVLSEFARLGTTKHYVDVQRDVEELLKEAGWPPEDRRPR